MNINGRHLTYCSNIHAGESWASVRETLGDVLPALRGRLQWDGPFGVGLRLSAAAAQTLEDAAALEEFRAFLSAGDFYVFTINGFPYGTFHGTPVKETVYEPDWRTGARVDYTDRLARILATLAPASVLVPSVSTVPGAFRLVVTSDADRRALAVGLLRHLATLVTLRARTGRTVSLAIEPEPACAWETTTEVVEAIVRWLCDEDCLRDVALTTGTPLSVQDVRRHIGICLDACHLAVAHEDPEQAVAAIAAAGLRIAKVQVSSALHVERPSDPLAREALRRFADDVYLHQVVEAGAAAHRAFVDLPEALASVDEGTAGHAPWRIHFHVPIFLESLGHLRTTQSHLSATLEAVCRTHACDQFEVETYTWDVLPEEHRVVGLVPAIARELDWARRRLMP
jgi:hypothetical protein